MFSPEAPSSTPTAPRGIVSQVRASHGPPQSQEEVGRIVRELRLMDPLLDILWNPKAILVEKGSYTETGKLIPPIFDGRWEVIRHQTENMHPERGDYAVICQLSQPARQDGLLYITKDGPYAPVGEWVLELMRSADAANVARFKAIRDKLWAQHDKLESDADKINESEAREGLDRVHFDANYAGGVGNWQGKGADFAAMAPSTPLIHQP